MNRLVSLCLGLSLAATTFPEVVAQSVYEATPLSMDEFRAAAFEQPVEFSELQRRSLIEAMDSAARKSANHDALIGKLKNANEKLGLGELLAGIPPGESIAAASTLVDHDNLLLRFIANVSIASAGDMVAAERIHKILIAKDHPDDSARLLKTYIDGIGIGPQHNSPEAIGTYLGRMFSPQPFLKKGDRLPELAFTLINGTNFTSKDLAGKTTIFHFWSTTCPPCMAKLSEVGKTLREAESAGWLVIFVNLDSDKQAFEKAIKKHKIENAKHTCTAKGWGDPLVQSLGINSVPFDIIVDSNGLVLHADNDGFEQHLTTPK